MRKVLLVFIVFAYTCNLYSKVSDFMVQPVPKRLDTKEDLLKLEIQTLYQNEKQDIIARNIYFLELALVLPFDNPIKALVKVIDEEQYKKYQQAVLAHINYRLAEEYIQYGRLFYKENIYFYNNDYYKEYLDGYEIAEFYFKSALIYRQKAAEYAQLAREIKGEINPNMDQTLIDFDQQVYYLTNNPYDYEAIYARMFKEVQENREKVLALQAASN